MKTMLHISTKQFVLTAALCLIALGAHAQSNDCPCADSLITDMECDVVYHDTIFAPENCPTGRDTSLWNQLPVASGVTTQWRGGEKIYRFTPPVDSLYTFYVDEVLQGDPDFWILDGCSDTAHNIFLEQNESNRLGYISGDYSPWTGGVKTATVHLRANTTYYFIADLVDTNIYGTGFVPPYTDGEFKVRVSCPFDRITSTDTCPTSVGMCTETPSKFVVDKASTRSYPEGQCDYLKHPSWWYMYIEKSGQIDIEIKSFGDVDFACYGPFDNVTCDIDSLKSTGPYTWYATKSGDSIPNSNSVISDLGRDKACFPANLADTAGKLVDAAYSKDAVEYLNFAADSGKYYMIIIANFARGTGEITFEQTNLNEDDAGHISCDVVNQCEIKNITRNIANCDETHHTYSVVGAINFSEVPADMDTLVIVDSVGNEAKTWSIAVTEDTPSPQHYEIDYLQLGSGTHKLTAYFRKVTTGLWGSSDTAYSCKKVAYYTAPTNCNLLSVELLSFSAECLDKNTALVTWRTAAETQNHHFALERSSDAINFHTLTTIAGAGQPHEYSFVDENILSGFNYYRLTQVNNDSSRSVSDIRYTNCSQPNGDFNVTIFPNPTNDEINVLVSNIDEPFTIEIIDNIGKTILTHECTPTNNEYKLVINMRDLQAAVYNLRLKSETKLVNQKIAKIN